MMTVEYKREKISNRHSGDPYITEGYCSNCGALVRKSQYGTDDECPECNAELDWESPLILASTGSGMSYSHKLEQLI